MQRVVITHKCGAVAEILSPEGDAGALERKRAELEARDCPYCEGDQHEEGWVLDLGRPGATKGAIDLWHWSDVTERSR